MEEHSYVETDPTGRHGRVCTPLFLSVFLCFSSFFVSFFISFNFGLLFILGKIYIFIFLLLGIFGMLF